MRIKERVINLISTMHDSCLQAQEEAKQKLENWINGIDEDMEDIEVLGTWVKHPMSIRGRNPEDFLPNYIHPKDLDLTFLSKINLKNVAPDLALVQENKVLKERNRELEQKLQEQDQKLLKLEAEMEKNMSNMNQKYAETQELLKKILESQNKSNL
jgi:nicotinamide riboside kinase